MGSLSNRNNLNRNKLLIKLTARSNKINSNHHLLKINALAVALPKSFSIKVAYPITIANNNSNMLINCIEDKILKKRFTIIRISKNKITNYY